MPEAAPLRSLFSAHDVRCKVTDLAARISRDYAGRQVLLVGVLKGAYVFLADIAREITVPVECDFVGVASYGDGACPTGEVRLVLDVSHPVKDRHVLLVEDIVDTGATADFLLRLLAARGPASLRLCALLDKPSRRRFAVRPDYVGFTVPNVFVVGYGLDLAQRYRALPYIGTVE